MEVVCPITHPCRSQQQRDGNIRRWWKFCLNGCTTCWWKFVSRVEVLSGQQGIGVDNNNENVKMEKRIMWTPEEDERLMSA